MKRLTNANARDLKHAIALAGELGAKKTYLTHISHQLGTCDELSGRLPAHVELALDGLQLIV